MANDRAVLPGRAPDAELVLASMSREGLGAGPRGRPSLAEVTPSTGLGGKGHNSSGNESATLGHETKDGSYKARKGT